MFHNPQTTPHSAQELIAALATARDTARVRMHLLSLDARDRWLKLESRIDQLQTRIERDEEKVGDVLSLAVHELTHAVQAFMDQQPAKVALDTPVQQLMQPAQVCNVHESLNRAAQIMWDLDCGAVPIVNDAGHLVGLITDRDVCMATYTSGRPLTELPVERAMARSVVSVLPSDPLLHACSLMREHQIRRLPVVSQGQVVGILALADVARLVEPDAESGRAARRELIYTLATICRPHAVKQSVAAE